MSSAPTPYTRQANFVSDAQNNANITVAQIATELDAEFNKVKQATDTTQSRLAEIQRDDGALKNGIVTPDAMSSTFTITSDKITNGAVTTTKIADNAVTAAKIPDTTITTAKLADNAVTSAKIVDGAVATAEIADLAVTAAKIATGTITSTQLSDSSVTSTKIANSAVTTGKLGGQPGTGTAALLSVNGVVSWSTDTARATHTHAISDVTGLATALATAGQVSSVAGRTGAVTLTKTDVGLTNVDNTSDANKPISSATQTALNAKANTAHTHTVSDITNFPSLGNAAYLTAPTSGNATTNQVVKGDDTRLTDSRTPTAHTHTKSQITDFPTFSTVATSGSYNDLFNRPTLSTVATTGLYSDLSNRPTLGSSSALDVPSSGDAGAAQVVKGNDSRLTDARTPLAHTHALSDVPGINALVAQKADLDSTGKVPFVQLPSYTYNVPQVTIGSVTTGAAGTSASATIGGTTIAPTLNLTIPRGDAGSGAAASIVSTSFTAAVRTSYLATTSLTVTDPATATAGDSYDVTIANGTVTIGGTAYSTSRMRVVRYYTGSAWTTLAPTLSDNLTVNANTATTSLTTNAPGLTIQDTARVTISSNVIALPLRNDLEVAGAGPVNSFTGGMKGAVYTLTNKTGSALVFTHNASSLVCPGAGNLTLGINETIQLRCDSASVYSILSASTTPWLPSPSVRTLRLNYFGTSSTTGSASVSVAGDAVRLSTGSTINSIASTSTANNTGIPLLGLNGDNAGGGYGGVNWTRDMLWDIPLSMMSTPACTGIFRVGTQTGATSSNYIEKGGWQIRMEFSNSTTFSVRFASKIGGSNSNSPNISSATNASPIVITTGAAHGLANGDLVEVGEVLGNTAANGIWTVANVTSTTFELSGSTGNGAYTSGGAVHRITPVLTTLGTGALRRFFVRSYAGVNYLIYGDDPMATPLASLAGNSSSVIGGGFQAWMQNTAAVALGYAGFWVGPVTLSVRA